jgi:hypothetical protein
MACEAIRNYLKSGYYFFASYVYKNLVRFLLHFTYSRIFQIRVEV